MGKKKIILIGPIYPYRGGIAHYTGLLYRTLARKYDVIVVSYKVQYPKLLFKRAQKDFSNGIFKVENSNFEINTANPINIAKAALKIESMKPDMVIMQWWHPYFAPCYWIMQSIWGKRIKKVFICHNVFPHERFPMDKFLTKIVLKKGDGFIVHSASDGKDLLSIKYNAVYRQNPHPTYNAFRIRGISKEQARKELRISDDTKLLLFFGFVRRYKGLEYLLRAMPMLRSRVENVMLLVVGAFGDDKENYMNIIRDNDIGECVQIIDKYIHDDEVEKYFAACDIVVLPYESATQSGIVQIAYGFEKAVIVTNVGGLPDVVLNNKTGYVVEPENPRAIVEAIEDFYVNNRDEEFCYNIKKEAYKYDWERIREKIEELYKNI